ncbi:uncharacterized protein BDR25DRAFT_340436 [Lindgomyces ingoldianus]|uniref:Uncharacterized protein n=1 Tax=Lindgomyces ingoldianus TaxID=673940 RepID=A0ACB6R824_9PLEO|nr:uncharacterized protein BDR25DRAFT_340436 [Lindgomyces ingoldianus]KAF2474672.1 hypothetical protein BDR25DRAFT_340436 [Lindgomyces ingoldianus]
MGLAAPKNRTRLSSDPQNKHWSSNTDRFGHRLLTSQGWTPGSSLGAKEASHASHYTAGSHSHVRVLLKDDTLGLGAKRGSERPENFGLAGLESILGRLNGKEEEVKKEQERKEQVERKSWVNRRYGFMNFVSGGFLVGDRIQKRIKKEVKGDVGEDIESEDEAVEKKSKKRKREKDDGNVKGESVDEQPKLKRKKKSMDLRSAVTTGGAPQADSSKIKSKSKKEKERKEKKSNKSKKSSTSSSTSTSESAKPLQEDAVFDKSKRKAEKRARKDEKKLKKALKRAAKETARPDPNTYEPTSLSSISEAEETDEATSVPISGPTTGTSTPLTSVSGLSFGAGGRHAVRQRYIRQKKMASMDPQALKEILMIKSPA